MTVATALPYDARCAGLARRAVTRTLEVGGCQLDGDIVLLLTSELVTNALLHGRPPIALIVTHTMSVLRVEVLDGSSAPPAQRVSSAMATSGRGLEMTDMLADRWGCAIDDESGSKCVWFEFDCGAS